MGILDDLSGSGILEFLRNNALNQNLNAGLTPDQSGYAQAPFSFSPAQAAPQAQPEAALMQQAAPVFSASQPSPLDTAQWPAGPMGAPSNAMAAMQPQSAALPPAAAPIAPVPQQAAPAGPAPFSMAGAGSAVGDRLMKGTSGFFGNLQNGPLAAVVGGVGSLLTGRNSDPDAVALEKMTATNSATARALALKGIAPEAIAAAHGNKELMSALIVQAYGQKAPTSIGNGYIMDSAGKVTRAYEPEEKTTEGIREYQFAKAEDPSLTFDKFMQRKKSVSGEFGMQPIWGTGPDGKPAMVQLGKNGEAKQSTLPQGFNLARDPVKVEGPTGTTLLDPQTRQPVGFLPKDVAGAAKSREIGEAEGQAVVSLPTTIATAESTLKTIQQLRDHPGKKGWGALGVGSMLPDMPGGATRGFAALLDQVKGQNFLTAFQALKGAGAITDVEGKKAQDAQARLDRAQSPEDFDIALKDLESTINTGMERARKKAGITTPAPAAVAAGPVKIDGYTITEQ